MDVYANMVKKIIEQQKKIIGPIALEQAKSIDGLQIDDASEDITITGNPKNVIDSLVVQYEYLFGQISVEVSRDAVASLISMLDPEDVPKTLSIR